MGNIFNKAKSFLAKKDAVETLWDNFTRPDIKTQLENYGAQTTSITIFNELPKVKISNVELQKLWDDFINENKFLYNLSIIETKLYKNGILAVGFEKGEDKNKPILIFGDVIKAEFSNNKLVYLMLKTYTEPLFTKNEQFKLYDITSDENSYYTTTREVNGETGKLKVSNEVNFYDFIPLVIFENLPKGKADLDLINQELFELINFDFELLIRDGYSSMPWVFYSETLQNEYGKLNFFNLDKRVIPKNALNQIYSDTPIELLQPNSTSPNILTRLERNINLVKELANLKQSTQSMGTKNLHGDEVQALNSNFETLIEFKANLREFSIKKLVEMFFDVIERDIKDVEIDVEVKGSTKYQLNVKNVKMSKLNGAAQNSLFQGTATEKVKAEEYPFELETT